MDTDASIFLSDIGQKLASDITAATLRNFQLVGDAGERFVIGTFGAAAALGLTAASFVTASGGNGDAEQMVDALWTRLRPMVVEAIVRGMEAND